MSFATRQLGTNGPQVTAIGFGLMGLSAFYGATASDEERFKFLDHLYNSGERFWDTSNVYGDSEELLGKWFKRNPGKRENIVLATKFGIIGSGTARTDPEFVFASCKASLERLQTDYIDLYYVHRANPDTPIEVTIRAPAELVSQGKIRHIGLSEVSPRTLRRAHAVHPISAVEMEYNPFSLETETIGLLDTVKELGVALVAYSPLGRGLMTGRYQSPDDFEEGDFRRDIPRFSRENFPKILRLVHQLEEIASAKGCTAGQLVLAWILAQWEMIIPIPGTKREKYFDENMGALNVKLSEDEVAGIRRKIEAAEVTGDRYPPTGWAETLFVDTVPEDKE